MHALLQALDAQKQPIASLRHAQHILEDTSWAVAMSLSGLLILLVPILVYFGLSPFHTQSTLLTFIALIVPVYFYLWRRRSKVASKPNSAIAMTHLSHLPHSNDTSSISAQKGREIKERKEKGVVKPIGKRLVMRCNEECLRLRTMKIKGERYCLDKHVCCRPAQA
jgi:hypothetical protein